MEYLLPVITMSGLMLLLNLTLSTNASVVQLLPTKCLQDLKNMFSRLKCRFTQYILTQFPTPDLKVSLLLHNAQFFFYHQPLLSIHHYVWQGKSSSDVITSLTHFIAAYNTQLAPNTIQRIHSDAGTEFKSALFKNWAAKQKIRTTYAAPEHQHPETIDLEDESVFIQKSVHFGNNFKHDNAMVWNKLKNVLLDKPRYNHISQFNNSKPWL